MLYDFYELTMGNGYFQTGLDLSLIHIYASTGLPLLVHGF